MGAGASTKNKGALPKAEIRLSFLLSGHASHADVADRIFDALAANIDGRVALQELRQYLISRDMWCKQSDVEALCAAIGASPAGITREQLRAGLDSDAGGKPPLLWLMALNPPPAGVGVFADLVRSDGPIDIADSAFRAITISQLEAVLAHAERRCEDEGWLGKRFDAGTHRYELLAADEVETLVQSPTWTLTDAHKRCCGGVFSVLEHSLDRDALRLDCPSEPLWFPRQACVVDTWTQNDDLSGDLQRVSLDGSGDWY